MSERIRWLDELDGSDLDIAGGKGASLGELLTAGIPVPGGFVVTTTAYRRFLTEADLEEPLASIVDKSFDDDAELAQAAARARERILETPMPEDLGEEIMSAYGELADGAASVAVRSSATAEDTPSASFAGQQETYLNITGESLLEKVQECWASLFTARAIYYRAEQDFPATAVDIAVVVQQMVDADVSGVLFTSHPSTGEPDLVIEASWGLGEAIVSGRVSPDSFVIERDTGRILEETIGEKRRMIVRDEETGETVEREVEPDRRGARVLDDDDLDRLRDLARRIERHYGSPQDVEWAICDGELFALQSRPITTLPDDSDETAEEAVSDEAILNGIGASPGRVTAAVRIVTSLDELDKVQEGEILVTEMTTPDMVPAMKRAAGIITDEGGMTSHASIVSRELQVPAVVGTEVATTILEDGQRVTIDGELGSVLPGRGPSPSTETEEASSPSPARQTKPLSATRVKVNLSIPEAAEKAAQTTADGVGLLRLEHLVISLGKTPSRYIADHGADGYASALADGIRTVADAFYPRPVRVRTLDAPTDEFRELVGGDAEPIEHNPMLGYRGIRRSLDQPEEFAAELQAFVRLYDLGYDNVEIMFPLVIDPAEVTAAVEHMRSVGIDPNRRDWGVMIETPASALVIDQLVETGIDFVSFGTNDLTQFTLALDRNNEAVADRFDELHPAVLSTMASTIETCREHDVRTSVCGQAGSRPRMIRFLVEEGISSISVNIDAIQSTQEEVMRVEQGLMLDSVR